jgi:uncharacterized protein
MANGSVEYRRRVLDNELDELLDGLAAISIDGPKGVGKTTTAAQRASTVFMLDRPEVAEIVAADPSRLAAAKPPVLIDEWQRLPFVWDEVRRAVDASPTPGRFLLTGSASPATTETHSGAGRIVPLRMRPLTLYERGVGEPTVSLAALCQGGRPDLSGVSDVGLEEYVDELLASGLPGVRNAAGRARRELLDGYLRFVIDRDFEEAGHPVRNPAALRRWMAAYAAATSTTASYETIRDAATSGEGDKPARSTTMPYRDTLERIWIVDPVPAWSPAEGYLSRLVQSPKHHLADPALAARLVGATRDTLLSGNEVTPSVPRSGTVLGALFESLVTLSVRVFAQACECRVSHLRTRGGDHEVDLIVERDDGAVVAIEVKLDQTVDSRDVRHLRWLSDELGDRLIDAFVVTTGTEAYRRRDGIGIVPAALLGP